MGDGVRARPFKKLRQVRGRALFPGQERSAFNNEAASMSSSFARCNMIRADPLGRQGSDRNGQPAQPGVGRFIRKDQALTNCRNSSTSGSNSNLSLGRHLARTGRAGAIGKSRLVDERWTAIRAAPRLQSRALNRAGAQTSNGWAAAKSDSEGKSPERVEVDLTYIGENWSVAVRPHNYFKTADWR